MKDKILYFHLQSFAWNAMEKIDKQTNGKDWQTNKWKRLTNKRMEKIDKQTNGKDWQTNEWKWMENPFVDFKCDFSLSRTKINLHSSVCYKKKF
jgi:hypothetical protein